MTLSYSQRRALSKRNTASLAREEREYRAHLAAEAKARSERAKAAHEARLAKDAADHAAALPLIPTLEPGDEVRDAFDAWYPVVRLNAKTVTVALGGTWTERIPFAKVLEVRKWEPVGSPRASLTR